MTDRLIAHLLRRATPAAHPRRIDELAGRSLDDAIGVVLGSIPTKGDLPWGPNAGPEIDDNDSWGRVALWWTRRMGSGEAGLIDRMAWFWHGHFTTADDAYDGPRLTRDQLEVLYRHGLGNLRTLLHGIITSGAMLRYLDAADSSAFNPNENLARELMELYTIGPGAYDENDVRGAARALAGWEVDDEQGTVRFDEGRAFVAPLLLLGEQRNWDTETLLNALCDHPRTAERVASRLWTDLVGTVPDADNAIEMGRWWRERDLEILPLVEQILRSDGFAAAELNRPRSGLEWAVGALSAFDPDGEDERLEPWNLDNLGQRPFAPPSPAGWPAGDYWTRPGSLLPRLQFVQDLEPTNAARLVNSAEAMLASAGLPDDDPTRAPLEGILADQQFDNDTRTTLAWRLLLVSPNFQMQ